MRVSWYVHAWQALLMFVAGVLCLLTSMLGYLRSGGGEELLQQALVSFMPAGGKAGFESLGFDYASTRLTVHGLHLSAPTLDSKVPLLEGLAADRFEVSVDLWPWPARIDAVHVHGMRSLRIGVESGFLQQRTGQYPKGPPFPIHFSGVDLRLKMGLAPELSLKNCSGHLRTGEQRELIGEVGFKELNGQPFDLSVASLADGRWTVRGANLNIDTQALQAPQSSGLTEQPFDPLDLLLRGLVSGEFGAKGKVSLQATVQPATASRTFSCRGEVAYEHLSLRFPPRDARTAQAVPEFLSWLLGGPQSVWPHWLVPDSIRTGPRGRLSFSMDEGLLTFYSDDRSVFTPTMGGRPGVPMAALTGSVATDAQQRPTRITLRGLVDNRLDTSLEMETTGGDARTFALTIFPRPPGAKLDFEDASLWSFRAQLEDHSARAGTADPSAALLKFRVQLKADHIQDPLLLPAGVLDFSGLLGLQGAYHPGGRLSLEQISWKKGGLVYGGRATPEASPPPPGQAYGPLFEGLFELWGKGATPWRLSEIDFQGQAAVQFDEGYRWKQTRLEAWRLAAGQVAFDGLTTDLSGLGITLEGDLRRVTKPEGLSVRIKAGVREGQADLWSMLLASTFQSSNRGELSFEERQVPLRIHPERNRIPSAFIHGLIFGKTVNRRTVVKIQDGQATRQVLALE